MTKAAFYESAQLLAVATVGFGIVWAVGALGFGPAWVIGSAAGAGAVAGTVYVAAKLQSVKDMSVLRSDALPESA